MDSKLLLNELVKRNLLTDGRAAQALKDAEAAKKPVEEILYERQAVNDIEIARIKSELLKVPYKKIDPESIAEELLKIVPQETVLTYKVVPLAKSRDMLTIGMLYPDDEKAQEALRFIAKQQKVNLGAYVISRSDFDKVLRRYSPYEGEIKAALRFVKAPEGTVAGRKIVELESKMSVAEEAPIIKIVAATLQEAVVQRASDIHIEPQRNRLRIRFRVDGNLREISSLPLELHQAIVSRVKVLAELQIDETRRPQDGRFRTILLGRDIDFRVATFPTPAGEKAALRVLDPTVGLKGLDELGLIGPNLEIVNRGLERPFGMILMTGPTGSGKTTTLYALMQQLNKEDVNIVSLEDPVEYSIDGLNQSQVRPDIGYDFASGLRQILRQDPDIIMVGEIRDSETAALAVHAALTGHIVLSTLHTNNAIGVIPRLIDMKVDAFLLPPSLNIMASQRLISRLCQDCKKAAEPPSEIAQIIKRVTEKINPEVLKKVETPYRVYRAEGCAKCNHKGNVGRLALFEVFQMTPELEEIINSGPSAAKIMQEAKRQGMLTLREDGVIKALQGLVPIEEVLRETAE